jgi:hypothetical protein
MAYIYPKTDPKWTKAIRVEAATPDGSFVNVVSQHHEEREWLMHPVENHNRWGDPSKGDVLVEVEGVGWLCVWFELVDIVPYSEKG